MVEIDKLKDKLDAKERVLFDKEISIQEQVQTNRIKLNNLQESKKDYEDKLNKYKSENWF